MRTVELRRHSFTKKGDARDRGSHLSQEGVRAAREVGTLFGAFDYVIASTSPRTMETAIAMGHAVDDLVEMPSPVETGEVEFHSWRAWADPFTTLRALAGGSKTLSEYMTRESERLLAAARRVDEGGRMLVVGHGGWLESVVAGLLTAGAAATVGGSFWHLDGIRLAITEESRVSVQAVHRFPQSARPSDDRLGQMKPSATPAVQAANGGAGVPRRKQTHSNVRDGKRYVWYTENLWPRAAELQVFEIALEEVKAWTGRPALDEDCWFGGRSATLRDVARHCARINATNLQHPIILNDDGSLMDGGHRVCRALLEGRSTVTAVQFSAMPPADEIQELSTE